jgi:hypothetical protein
VQATYYVDEGLIEVITDGVAGDSGPTLGGPGDGSLGTSDKYIPIDSVIEHGDLSGQGGIMHDASQISITDDGEYFASGNVEAALQELGPLQTVADYLVGHRLILWANRGDLKDDGDSGDSYPENTLEGFRQAMV